MGTGRIEGGDRSIRNARSLKSWLAQVLRSTLADYYRRAGVRKKLQERLLRKTVDEAVVTINDEAEQAVCACLYRLLPTLHAEYAQVIWRVDLLGQPRATVARSLGISTSNLGVRIHRARQALRGALERFCITCPVHGFLNCACEEATGCRGRRQLGEEQSITTARRSAARFAQTARQRASLGWFVSGDSF